MYLCSENKVAEQNRLYYLCSENKGADQLCSSCEADLRLCFRLFKLLIFPCGGSYIKVFPFPFKHGTFYSPALEKWGYTGFTLSFRGSVIPSFREHFVSAQYLKNNLTESDQILYAHQH